MKLKEIVNKEKDRIIKSRRDLHSIPEPGFKEKKTASYVADYLQKEGFTVETSVAETGVVGLLKLPRPGKTVMVRADMDAIPVSEESGAPFASIHPGFMHACGHDGHMAMVLGAATIINQLKENLNGFVKFVFQPAEELASGAKAMIEAGVLEHPAVNYVIGCHLSPFLPEGTIGVKEGPVMAATDWFDITITGIGGHGAMPHLCVDALDVGTQVVNAFQRIVSRKIDPTKPAIVTVGSFHAGNAFNVIAKEAKLSGTTRAFDRQVWTELPEQLENILHGVSVSMGAKYELNYMRGNPPLFNDTDFSEVVRQCAGAVVGPEKVLEPQPFMGGEDMAFFIERVTGCFFFVGCGFDGCAFLHNPEFTFREDVLLNGVETFVGTVVKLLS